MAAELARMSRPPFEQESLVTGARTFVFGGMATASSNIYVAKVTEDILPGGLITPAVGKGIIQNYDDGDVEFEDESDEEVEIVNVMFPNAVMAGGIAVIAKLANADIYLLLCGAC